MKQAANLNEKTPTQFITKKKKLTLLVSLHKLFSCHNFKLINYIFYYDVRNLFVNINIFFAA